MRALWIEQFSWKIGTSLYQLYTMLVGMSMAFFKVVFTCIFFPERLYMQNETKRKLVNAFWRYCKFYVQIQRENLSKSAKFDKNVFLAIFAMLKEWYN